MSTPQPIHATLVAHYEGGDWRSVLLRGPSGAGKSGLALALIGRGWRLVADDRVLVWRSGGQVWGRPPKALQGLLEVRGVGVLPFATLSFARIDGVAEGVAAGSEIKRIPTPSSANLCDISLPVCSLDLAAPDAADKVAAFCGALQV